MLINDEILDAVNKALKLLPNNEHLKRIKEAIEKQLPVKAINIGETVYIPICPKCKNPIIPTTTTTYCEHCGQAITLEEVKP